MSKTRKTLTALRVVLSESELTARDKVVWLGYRLRDHHGKGTFISDDRLARDLSMNPRAVQRARARLMKLGYLLQQKRGPQTANYWAITPDECSAAGVETKDGIVPPLVEEQTPDVPPPVSKQEPDVSPHVSPHVSPPVSNRILEKYDRNTSVVSLRSTTGADAPLEKAENEGGHRSVEGTERSGKSWGDEGESKLWASLTPRGQTKAMTMTREADPVLVEAALTDDDLAVLTGSSDYVRLEVA